MTPETCEHCGGELLVGSMGLVCERGHSVKQDEQREAAVLAKNPNCRIGHTKFTRKLLNEIGEAARKINEE